MNKYRFELICGNRTQIVHSGLPLYMGTKVLKNWTMDMFPAHTKFTDKGEYITAYFTTKRGIRREIDIFNLENEK
jgi:hypothetical protein